MNVRRVLVWTMEHAWIWLADISVTVQSTSWERDVKVVSILVELSTETNGTKFLCGCFQSRWSNHKIPLLGKISGKLISCHVDSAKMLVGVALTGKSEKFIVHRQWSAQLRRPLLLWNLQKELVCTKIKKKLITLAHKNYITVKPCLHVTFFKKWPVLFSIVFMKNDPFFTEWVTTHSLRFLARHHWHNATEKWAVF